MDIHPLKEIAVRKPWKILVIDDDEDDLLIVKEMLKEARGSTFEVHWASSYCAGCEALHADRYNAVLVDYDLGAETGIQLIREAVETGYAVPLILFTGRGSYAVDVEAMSAGATLYLPKGDANPLLLERSIRYAIELKQREQALRASEERFEKAFNASPNAQVISHIEDGRIETINDSFEKLFGYLSAEVIGRTSLELNLFVNPADREEAIRQLRVNQRLRDFVLDIRTKSGEVRTASLSIEVITIGGQQMMLTVMKDITEHWLAQAQLKLHASLLDTIHDAVIATDLNQHITAWNQAAVELYGYEAHEALGKIGGEFLRSVYTNDQREGIKRQLAETGRCTVEMAQYTRDGRKIIVEGTIIPRRDNQGKIIGYVTANRDITARKRREANLAFLADIAQDFSLLSTSDEIMEVVGSKLGAYLNVFYCHFVYIDEARDEVVYLDRWNANSVPRLPASVRLSAHITEAFRKLVYAGQTVVSNDTLTDPIMKGDENIKVGAGSFITVPFHHKGEWKYLFSVHDLQARQWAEDEIELVREVAYRLFPRLDRARAEEALRASETKYRSLYESMDEGFMLSEIIFDEQDRPVDILYHQANPAAVRMLGMDYTGKRLTEIDPHFEPYWFETWGRVARTGVGERQERFAEPLKTWYNFYTFRVGGPGSRMVANVFEDITQRKQAEAALAQDLHDTRLLQQLSTQLIPEDNIDILYDKLVKAAMVLMHSDMGSIQVLAPEQGVLNLMNWQGFHPASAQFWQRVSANQTSSCAAALDRHERVIVPDVEHWDFIQGTEDLAYYRLSGIRAMQSTPLISRGGQLLGVISTHWRQPYQPTERELRLFDILVRQAADMVERAQAEKALRESEARFRTSVESLAEAFKILSAVRADGKIIDFRYEYVNEAACRLSHHSREQLIGMNFLQLMPQMDGTGIIERFAQVVESGQPLLEQAFAWDFQEPARSRALYDIRIARFGDGIIMTIDDVTELTRLEAERQKAIRDREVQRHLADQREMERQSIARDIHDGPIQTLSSLLFNLQSLREVYTDPALQYEIDQVKLSIKSSVQELRQVMYELRPPSVIQFGLARAIQSHNENLLEIYPQITWSLELDDDQNMLPPQTCLMLFRVYQEAVNNILRHSDARQAWVTLNVSKDQLVLKVRDNGRGFVKRQDFAHLTENRHFGLAGMAERVEAIHGEFDIQSTPGEGTVIIVKVPATKDG